jgi:hypothetical protein
MPPTRSSSVVHKGRQVTIHDYSGIGEAEFVPTIARLTAEITGGAGRDVLLLLDITGCTISKEVLLAFKRSAAEVRPFVRDIAVVGVEGLQLFFLNVVNLYASLEVKPFATREEALDHLVK